MERPVEELAPASGTDSWFRLAISGGVPRRSFFAALVVGTVLNLINQGTEMLSNAPIDYLEFGLTYVVPYLVATYGSVTAQLQARRNSGNAAKGD